MGLFSWFKKTPEQKMIDDLARRTASGEISWNVDFCFSTHTSKAEATADGMALSIMFDRLRVDGINLMGRIGGLIAAINVSQRKKRREVVGCVISKYNKLKPQLIKEGMVKKGGVGNPPTTPPPPPPKGQGGCSHSGEQR